MKIVFSIPSHERPDVVIDQLINYSYYNEEAIIVLHLSEFFNWSNSLISKEEFYEIVNLMDFVFINPTSLRSGFLDIIQCHISNFNFIKNKIKFDYFCLDASNSIFVKSGLAKKIENYDVCHCYNTDKSWFQMKGAKLDLMLYDILIKENINEIVGSQVEGTFYKKEIFNEICMIISKYFDHTKIKHLYAREEIYFSTVCTKFDGKLNILNVPYIYIDWADKLRIDFDKINIIKNGNKHYGVKRINREMSDIIRQDLAKEINAKAQLKKYNVKYEIIDKLYYFY